MPNLLNTGKPVAGKPATPPAAAIDPQAYERALREAGAAEALRAENLRLRREAAPQAPPQPPPPDGFAHLAGNVLTAPPEEVFNALDAGVRGRIRQEVGPVLQEMERRRRIEKIESENSAALGTILSMNPDIATDPEGYAAAVTRAGIRAQNQGINLSGADMARYAVSIYREDHPTPAEMPPTLESGGRPGGRGAPERPKGKSWYERFYGKRADDELHEEELDHGDMLNHYKDKRMEFLEKAGVALEFSGVQDVLGQEEERAARNRAAAGSAAAPAGGG